MSGLTGRRGVGEGGRPGIDRFVPGHQAPLPLLRMLIVPAMGLPLLLPGPVAALQQDGSRIEALAEVVRPLVEAAAARGVRVSVGLADIGRDGTGRETGPRPSRTP